MTLRETLREVFEDHPGFLRPKEVIARIYRRHPDRPWKEGAIRCHLTGLSHNQPGNVNFPTLRRQAFLFWEKGGRYRRWDPVTDGAPPKQDVPRETDASGEAVGPGHEPEPTTALPETAEAEGAPLSTALSLERDLEETLVRNLPQLEPGLRLHSTPDRYGRQFDTGVVGVIDLLAVDETGSYVVVELKAGRAEEKALAQVLKYMGWVKQELAGEREVRGIIVANNFADSLKFAVQAAPQVRLIRYEVHFTFSSGC